MKLKIKTYLNKQVVIVFTMLFSLLYFNALSQIPASLEKELDRFNDDVYKALQILNTQPESVAISKVAVIKADLIKRSQALLPKLEALPDLTEEQDEAFTQKQLAKPTFQNLMKLMSDEKFNQKIAGNSRLQIEYAELMALLDMGESSETEEVILPESSVCSFTVSPEIPNSGLYTVTSDSERAVGFPDDTEGISIEIYGKARGNDILLTLIADEFKPGKYTWSVEGQIYIQSEDEDGNEVIQLQNRHEDGYIEIETIGEIGEKITGSFHGLFFDDMEQTQAPVKVEGKFSVTRVESNY